MIISTPGTCFLKKAPYLCRTIQHNETCSEPPARVAQLVERDLAKVEVASSNLVSRSIVRKKTLLYSSVFFVLTHVIRMAATRKCLSTDDEFRQAVSESLSVAQVLGRIGLVPAGGNYKTVYARIAKLGLDTSHWTGAAWNQGGRYKSFGRKATLEEILVENSPYNFTHGLRKRLLEESVKARHCEDCGLVEWKHQPIPLELHHRNGINNDHRLENLQLLCPNCHALTENYRGKTELIS
jgi:hypothetical protein